MLMEPILSIGMGVDNGDNSLDFLALVGLSNDISMLEPFTKLVEGVGDQP